MSLQSLAGGPDLTWAMGCLISGTSQHCQNATKKVCILRFGDYFAQWLYVFVLNLASSKMFKLRFPHSKPH